MSPSRPFDAELWILIDGLGWEFVQQYGFLDELTARSRLRTVLGYSSTAIPSLMTGLAPSEHGGWTLYFRSPSTSPFSWTRTFRWIPIEHIPKLRWKFRDWLHAETVKRNDISGYFALYDVPLRYRWQFDVAWRNSLFVENHEGPETFLDHWRSSHPEATFAGTYPLSDAQIADAACSAIQRGASRVFCYFGELDGALHRFASPEPNADLAQAFDSYQNIVQEIRSALDSRGHHTRVVVFSDHGMTPVLQHVDIAERLSGLRLGAEYMCFLDSTLARFWADDAVLHQIRRRLDDAPGDFLDGPTLTRERLPNRPDLFGDLVWLAKPHVLITPSWMGRDQPNGMHGYSPADPWSDGVTLTNDPSLAPAEDVVDLGQRLVRLAREG